MRKKRFIALGLLVFLQVCAQSASAGGTTIVRDNTLNPASRSTTIAASGVTTTAPGLVAGFYANRSGPGGTFLVPTPVTYNSYLIPESIGQRSGANVFHSFSTFNVGNGDAAVFNGFTGVTNNVITRVTGGTASTIAGLLQVDRTGGGATANLFLVNPAGIVLAPGAAIDVPGSVHLTTANYIKFPDGNFHADTNRASTLSAADPAAFGFLGTTRAALSNNANLPVAGSISLTGGDVNSGNFLAPLGATGAIRITAVGQDTVEIPLSGPTPTVHGAVAVTGSLFSTASSPGSGIAINTGSLTYGPFALLIQTNNGADISINAANDVNLYGGGAFAGIQTDAAAGIKGGNINLNVGGTLSLFNGAGIRAATNASGRGGDVIIRAAGNILIDGRGGYDNSGIFSFSNGNGFNAPNSGSTGNVDVAAAGNITIFGEAQISNTTFSGGNAGNLTVSASSITLDGTVNVNLRDFTGITSNARRGVNDMSTPVGGYGNAGNISIFATDTLSVLNGARISSSTYVLTGNSGNVSVQAGSVVIDGFLFNRFGGQLRVDDIRGDGHYYSSIQAAAKLGSSGQTGNVSVAAASQVSLSNGGQISIQNDATQNDAAKLAAIMPTTLTVSSANITLKDANITASSTGNVPASNVKINFTNTLKVDPSTISTSSNLGNGGAIVINGAGGAIILENSQITTSVSGLTGNGGDISIFANALLMNSGFIQANTAAAQALGGNVTIGVNSLITSGNSLFLGGNTPYTPQPFVFGFNVIQAASPTGVSGAIALTSPVVDVARSVTGVTAKAVDAGGLGRSPCRITGGSSLAQAGRGGLPPSATDLLAPGASGVQETVRSADGAGPATARVAMAEGSVIGRCN